MRLFTQPYNPSNPTPPEFFVDQNMFNRDLSLPIRWIGVYGMGFRPANQLPSTPSVYEGFSIDRDLSPYFEKRNMHPAVRTYLWPLMILHALNLRHRRAFIARWLKGE